MTTPDGKAPPPAYEPPSRRANLGGRPTLLNDDMIREICRSLEGAVPLETAAAKQGISSSTARDWLRRGARDIRAGITDSLHARFADLAKQADAYAEERLTLHASKAAEKYWIAAVTLLERRWPNRWKRPTDDRENRRVVMETALRAVVDTIRLVRDARPGMTDDELVAYVFEHIELPFEDAPEPTSPRDATATTPVVVQAPPTDGGKPAALPAGGPVIDVEEAPPGLEEQRREGAEQVLKGEK
jgi:hypothetical protein